MKFTQVPATLQRELQMNAGIVVKSFNPETLETSGLLGATSGGTNFSDVPTYADLGDDIDNCPKNTKELKRITGRDIKASGSFVTITPEQAKRLVAAGSIADTVKIVPRDEILDSDFEELWLIGDYSDVNTGESAGFFAIKLMNALNTSGFQIQTADRAKGTFAFEFTAHYSISSPTVVPYEMYVKAGTASGGDASIMLDKHVVTVINGETATLSAVTTPAGQTVTWSSAAAGKATVTSGGVVEGKAVGNTIVTASITKDGVTYTDTCTVIVIAAS